MIRGLYTSGWGMLALNKKMDVISNNLANASTNAFKKDTVVLESFPEMLTKRISENSMNPKQNIGHMQLSSDIGEISTNYSEGFYSNTNNNLDFAIKDSKNAFFTIAIPKENDSYTEYYTRDGGFKLDSNNRLVTSDGSFVLGQNGVIALKGNDFSIKSDGTIIEDGEKVDKLLIKQFENPQSLRKYGNNLVQKTQETNEEVFKGNVLQGYIEQSNVNSINEMVEMINVVRAYEANQKVIQAQDSTLDKAVNEVGRT